MPVEPCGYEFGSFRVDLGERELRRGGHVIELTAKTFDLLLLLLRQPGRTQTKSELLGALWPDTVVEESNLTQTVFMLRKALGDDDASPSHIQTVPRRGYKFISAVAPVYPQGADTLASVERATAGVSRPRRRWIPVAVAASLLTAGIAWRYAETGGSQSSRVRSIAVLPLRNLTGSAEQDYLAGGMTEILTTGLGQIGELTVIASSSARHYEASRMTASEIARELHVDALVEGAVQRAGNRLVITARLIDGPSQRQLWAKSFERDAGDIISLGTDVTAALAQEVQLTLTAAEQARLARHRAVSPEAQEAYLRALDAHQRADFPKELELLLQATEKDSAYAEAWAALGDAYGILTNLRILPQKETYPKWVGAVTRALELDDSLPEAHRARGALLFFRDWNWSDAETEFRSSLRLNPNDAAAHQYYGNLLTCLPRLDEAVDELKKSVLLDPHSLAGLTGLGGALLAARRNDEAIDVGRELIQRGTTLSAELESPGAGAQFAIHSGHMMIGLAEEQKGNLQKAIEEFQRESANLELARVYAHQGKRKEAKQTFDAITNLAQERPMALAAFWAAMGDNDKAFAWLDKGYDPPSIGGIKTDHRVDPLRTDPRYAEVLRRIGLPP